MKLLNNIFSISKHKSVQIILTLAIFILVAEHVPIKIQQGFYTISLLIKELLIWIIPITVTMYVANTIQSFEKRAPLFVLVLIIFETLSNFTSVWYSYITANFAFQNLTSLNLAPMNNDFKALWHLPLIKPNWWAADRGAMLGLILGGIAATKKEKLINRFIQKGNSFVEWILTRIFSRLIPLFILGFACQIYQMKLLNHVFVNYSVFVVWLMVFLFGYISFLFIVGAGGSLYKAAKHMRNLLSAGGIAITSSCSLSTMPWTIQGTAKNLQNPFLAKAIIPATTNIQQVGDAITNSFLCFLIYKNFNGVSPDLVTWFQFSIVFVIARFATAAVMGGAIFIMLPIYETYLGFNAEMIAIILALNVVLDPLVTCTNVVANGALCKIFENIWVEVLLLADKIGLRKSDTYSNIKSSAFLSSKIK